MVLIRKGKTIKDPSDQQWDCFELCSADPTGTFLVCYNLGGMSSDCPELVKGLGVLLEIISGIESKIGTQSDVDPEVKAREKSSTTADRHAASSAKKGMASQPTNQ
jgi:hypothetical protein